MSYFYFSDEFDNSSEYNTYSYTQSSPAPLKRKVTVKRSAKLLFVLTQLLRTTDLYARSQLLAQLDCDEQLAVLSLFARIKYHYNIYRRTSTYSNKIARKHATIIALYEQQYSVKQIAQLTNTSTSTVYRVLSEHNFTLHDKRSYNKLSSEEKALIQQMLALNASIAEIARQLNRHVSTVYYYIKRLKQNREQQFLHICFSS